MLDIRMPDFDGFETCERIKRLPGMNPSPVIFLFANVYGSARKRALEVGGFAFLSKPCEAADAPAEIQKAAQASGKPDCASRA